MRIVFVFILKQESVQFPKLNSMHSDVLSNTGAVCKSTISGLVFFFIKNVCIVVLNTNAEYVFEVLSPFDFLVRY